jgi:hypothetical protein
VESVHPRNSKPRVHTSAQVHGHDAGIVRAHALDRSHLMPRPVLCLEDRLVCTACGASIPYRPGELAGLWEWLAEHRRHGDDACAV